MLCHVIYCDMLCCAVLCCAVLCYALQVMEDVTEGPVVTGLNTHIAKDDMLCNVPTCCAVLCCAVLCSAGYGGCDRGPCCDRPQHACGQECRRAQGLVQQRACKPGHPGQGLWVAWAWLADAHFAAAAVGDSQLAMASNMSDVLMLLPSTASTVCRDVCEELESKRSPLQRGLCAYVVT
jgi:hypothetical protein